MSDEFAEKYEIDMCSGPILRKMLMFSFPLMCSGLIQLLFNAVDIIVVGRFVGDNALAAVGACTALVNLLIFFINGLAVGTNVLVARFYGGQNENELSESVHTSMFFALIAGNVLTILGVGFAERILIWMKTPMDVLPLATTYFRVYCLGITATTAYSFGNAIFRAVGDTKRPLYYLIASGIINLILNLIFVTKFNMSVLGVSLATVISQYISAFLIVRCMLRSHGAVALSMRKLQIRKEKLKQILVIGLPASIQEIMFGVSGIIVQSAVNTFGTITIAGNSVATNIEGFFYVPMNAFYQASIAFTGQNMGAGKYKRIDKVLICAEGCSIASGLIMGVLTFCFGEKLLGLYTISPLVIHEGMKKLNIVAKYNTLSGLDDVIIGSISGLGHTMLPMFVSMLGICGVRIAWIWYLFELNETPSVISVYMSYPISWIISFCIQLVCFLIIRKRTFPSHTLRSL